MTTHKRAIHPSWQRDGDVPSRAVCARVGQKNCHHTACPKHMADIYPWFATHRRAVLVLVK